MQYFEPNFLDEALVLLDRFAGGARVLAGATRLGPQLRDGADGVETLLNVKRVPELRDVHFDGVSLRIGALVTARELAEDALVRTHAPLVALAAATVGARQLRCVATIGGNICSGDPAADLSTALLACDAVCCIASIRHGSVETPIDRIFKPNVSGLPSGELLVAVRIPAGGACAAYQKMTTRRGFEMALVAVAASLSFEAGHVRRARIALAGAAPTVLRAAGAEAALAGRQLTRASADAAARVAADADAQPLDDHRASARYRRHLVATLTRRALLAAGAPERGAAA